MIWRDPIYDRTQADIDYAIAKITEWKRLIARGERVNVIELKGCLNLSDITRIEDNIKYLSDALNALGYHSHIFYKTWAIDGLPDINDVRRILNNVLEIIESYHQPNDVPFIPNSLLTYQDVNSLELNLFKIKQMIDSMIMSFPKSGKLSSNGLHILPMRR